MPSFSSTPRHQPERPTEPSISYSMSSRDVKLVVLKKRIDLLAFHGGDFDNTYVRTKYATKYATYYTAKKHDILNKIS
jgi:hypothetical protein